MDKHHERELQITDLAPANADAVRGGWFNWISSWWGTSTGAAKEASTSTSTTFSGSPAEIVLQAYLSVMQSSEPAEEANAADGVRG